MSAVERLTPTGCWRFPVAAVGFAAVVALTLAISLDSRLNPAAAGDDRGTEGRADPEAVEFNPTRFPSRDIRTQSPYFQSDSTGTNPEYMVHPNDTLVCWLESSDKLLTLAAANPVDFGWMLKGDMLVRCRELRIPCSFFLIRTLEAMSISVADDPGGPNATIPIYDSNHQVWLIESSSVSWSKLSAMMERWVVPIFRAKKYTIRYKLMPQERVYPLPGDKILLERVSVLPKVVGNPDNTPTVSEYFHLEVDSGGYLHIPVAANPAARAPKFAIERGAFSEIGSATNRIKVCFPHLPTSKRCSLADISACLSASPGPKEKLPEYVDQRCRLLGIDDHLRPLKGDDGVRNNIRYFITPAERTWTLVLENGEPTNVRYTNSTPIRQAVGLAYRARTGRGLFHKCSSLTIEVMTESGRVEPDEPGIFTGVLRRNEVTALDSALVLPGDVVRLLPSR